MVATELVIAALALVAGIFAVRWVLPRLHRRFVYPRIERAGVSFFDAFPIGREDTVFFGDSITAGGQWEEIAPGAGIRNRGIGGDRTTDLLRRLDPITLGRPRRLFLVIGTNDVAAGVAEADILRNIESILDAVRDASPETRVFLHEVFPRHASFDERIRALNAALDALADRRGLPLVRVFEEFVDARGGIRAELTYDDLHLSGAGYRAWQTVLTPHLEG